MDTLLQICERVQQGRRISAESFDLDCVYATLLPKYDKGLTTASKGKSYTECFELATGRPTDEYLALLQRRGVSHLGWPDPSLRSEHVPSLPKE